MTDTLRHIDDKWKLAITKNDTVSTSYCAIIDARYATEYSETIAILKIEKSLFLVIWKTGLISQVFSMLSLSVL